MSAHPTAPVVHDPEGTRIPHVLGYLGSTWSWGEKPRFPDALVVAYTAYVKSRRGVVTWDVPVEAKGRIAEPFIRQLRAVGHALAGAEPSV